MRNLKLLLIVFALVACCSSALSQARDPKKLDQYFESLQAHKKLMGSVSVFKDGTEIYSKAVGFADIDKSIAADTDSKYRIGSISKTFTSTMIFQAIEAGKLSLDDTIEKYFPSIQNPGKITVAHLLSHRSGIHNFSSDEDYPDWSGQYKDREAMIEIIASAGIDFEPDANTRYSNSNYVLLSYILETIYNKTYAEILSDQIAKPLSLQNTYFGKGTVDLNDRECNSYKYFDKWRIESLTNPSIPMGAGGIVSTPRDLNTFADALFGGKLVSASSLSTMQTNKSRYGMGMFPVPFHGKKGYGHSGGIDGFQGMLIHFPEDNLSYAILSNGVNFNFNDINIAVLSWVYDRPFTMPIFVVIDLKSEDLDKYLGVYASSQIPLKLTITKSGNTLIGQGTGQPSFPLEPTSVNVFKFAQGGLVMEFNPEENTMILKQGGGVFYFKRE